MNLLDWIMVALLVVGVIYGYVRGFVKQIISIVGSLIAFLAAYIWYADLAVPLSRVIPIKEIDSYEKYEFMIQSLQLDVYFFNAIAFGVLFFGVKLGLVIVGRLLHIVTKLPGLNFINRWTGALLAGVEVVIIVVIAVNVMTVYPKDSVQTLLADSIGATWCIEQFPVLAANLHALWEQSSK